jgi:hypothetical protein
MNADLEKEYLALRVNSNALNQRAAMLLMACEVIAEYRQLNGQLMQHTDKLRKYINDCPTPTPFENGRSIPSETCPVSI